MPALTVTAEIVPYALNQPFRIARGGRDRVEGVRVTIADDLACGRGEAIAYRRFGETPESALAAIGTVTDDLAAGRLERHGLLQRLPAGAARNAIDLALWDFEAKRSGVPVARLAQVAVYAPLGPVATCHTLSLDTPEAMAQMARQLAPRFATLKLKLGGEGDLARVQAVRAAAPQARLLVDANESWTPALMEQLMPAMAALQVALVEQPLPAREDAAVAAWRAGPVPVCADESLHPAADLDQLAARYRAVNIKLDKAGGLTAALAQMDAARARGMLVMVGCMVASSLAVAPAVLLAAAGADLADLDGSQWIADDVQPALQLDGDQVQPPDPALWG